MPFWVWLILAMLAFAMLQLMLDMLFLFICYVLGWAVLYILKFANTEHQLLSYPVFKENYPIDKQLRRPVVLGYIVIISTLVGSGILFSPPVT